MNTLKILVIMLSLLLNACSSAGLYVFNKSLKVRAIHSVEVNISFAEEEWQKLDIHIPDKLEKEAPVIIFFYGGSWDSGKKEMYYFVGDAFARLGYIVVIPDYQKYPTAKFPTFIKDGAAAFAWTKQHIAKYGGDPDNIFLAGHSAGAHLGGLLAADRRYLAEHGFEPKDIRGFSGLAGPYNFTPESKMLIDIFGPPENFPNMQAMNFVDGDEPIMLFLHGEGDDTVGVENQNAYLRKLESVGNQSTGKLYPKLSHVGILLSLARPLKRKTSTLEDMDVFFKSEIVKHKAKP